MNAAERFFVDTNILFHSIDSANFAKQARVAEWLDYLRSARGIGQTQPMSRIGMRS